MSREPCKPTDQRKQRQVPKCATLQLPPDSSSPPFCFSFGADSSRAVPLAELTAQTNNDRDALVAFYHATDGPNWTNNENWLSDQPLDTWHGVNGQ